MQGESFPEPLIDVCCILQREMFYWNRKIMKPIRLLGLYIMPRKMMCSCHYLASHNLRNTPNKYSWVSAVRTMY